MVRRRASAFAASLLLLGVLVGCGGGGAGASAASITMWTYPVIDDAKKHRAFWDQTEAAFEKKHPKIDVKVNIYPWDNREQALTTAIAARKGPDVVYLIPDQIAKYNAQNAIEPLGEHLPADATNGYLKNALDAVTFDGELLAMPVLMSAIPTLCDKRAFEKVGIEEYPQTWDELLAMAPKFKAAGYDVTAYLGSPKMTLNQTFYPLLWQAGGRIFTPDGKNVAFNGQAGVEALSFVKQLVDGGHVDKSLLTSLPPIEQTKVAQGKVACIFHQAPSLVTPLWGAENTVVLPPLKQDKRVMYGTVGAYSMLSGAQDKDAAAQWITYITSPQVMKKYDKAAGYFAPRQSIDALYADDPVLGELEKLLKYTTVGTVHPKARDVMAVLAPQIQAALLGKKSPKRALDDAAKAAQPLLN